MRQFEVIGLEKVKFLALASKPQDFENWPIFGSRTALFLELLKVCEAPEKFLENVFFWRSPETFFCRPFFWGGALALVSAWPQTFLSLASRGSVLGKVVLGLGFFCVLGL